MSKFIRFLALPMLASTILAWSVPVLGEAMEAAAIKRDPFQSPKRTAERQEGGVSAQPDQPEQKGQTADAHQVNLRAIIYDPKKPLVNIGGQIIEVGGSLHGYTLVNVGEREATLTRNGQPIKLSIDGVAGQ